MDHLVHQHRRRGRLIRVNPLTQPLNIGPLAIPTRVTLAPMAGVTAWPMRSLCKARGCAMTATEMVSVKSLLYAGDTQTAAGLLERGDESGPLALQLFGAEGEDFADAIRYLYERGRLGAFDAIDVNMGCPAPKVTRSGAGSALLLDLPRAARIIAAAVRTLERVRPAMPVTVKTRLGWDAPDGSAVALARIARDEGASAVTVHGRTRAMQYSGRADLDGIAAVKAAVSIPVIGNGDIASRQDAMRMMAYTGCDGVMIGRAAIGNPWVFAGMADDEAQGMPSIERRLDAALTHARTHCAWRGVERGMIELRGQLGWYLRGLPGAVRWRTAAHQLNSVDALTALINETLETLASSTQTREA